MTGGLMKTASRAAIAAAAGVLATQAWAADLGGNCCVDLEERVAELEATAARKGTRRMGLQLYGQVSEAVLFWDDGGERNVYVAENNNQKNRFGAQGSAKIVGDWSAGFRLEWQVRAFRSSSDNQLARGDNNAVTITTYNTQSLSLRHASWFLKSDRLGTLVVGQTDDSAFGVYSINLGDPDGFAAPGGGFINGAFRLRRAGTVGNAGLSSQTWTNAALFRNGDGPAVLDYVRASSVRYISPTFMGFTWSASWGEDDFWSTALRYSNEFNGVRVAAGVAYEDVRDDDRTQCTNLGGSPTTSTVTTVSCNTWQAGASVMHMPTGLYISGGGGQITDDNRRAGAILGVGGTAFGAGADTRVDNTDVFWWVQVGWAAKLVPLGDTTFWVDFERWENGFNIANNVPNTVGATDQINSLGVTAFIASSQTDSWGFGVTQAITAASMNLYLGFRNFSTDIVLQNPATGARQNSRPVDDFSVVYTGATVKF